MIKGAEGQPTALRSTAGAALPYSRSDAKTWAKERLRGFYECPMAPLTADFEIDVKGTHELADIYAEWGIPGVVVGGNNSEGWNMPYSKWAELHRVWSEAARGRFDLWTILLDPSVQVCLEKVELVRSLGFIGAEVVNPVVQLVSDQDIFEFFEYLTDHTDLAIMLYRTRTSGRIMDLELIRRLSNIDSIVGVKEGSLQLWDFARLQRLCHPDFIVSTPGEEIFLEYLRRGGQHLMWAGPFYSIYGKYRTLFKEYFDAACAGDWLTAAAASDRLEPVREIWDEVLVQRVQRTGSYASSTAWMKAWFEAVGLPAGPPLPPLRQLSAHDRETFYDRLETAGVI